LLAFQVSGVLPVAQIIVKCLCLVWLLEYLMNKDPGLNLSAPTADTSLDNLTRQGFSKDDTSENPWHPKSNYILRNKVISDFHQTNPHLDIQPTGHCEYWVHEVCLMDHIDQNTQPHEQESQPISYSTILPHAMELTGSAKACSHPNASKFSIKNTTKPNAQAFTMMSALHSVVQSFASELIGLFVRKAMATKQFDSKLIKDSFHRILPPHAIAAFKHCANPRGNGLTTGLQSRPPTLLEQPPM